MSRVLVEKETIYTEEVAMLMKGASYSEVIAYMENNESTHQDNPFARATEPQAEHLTQTQEGQETTENE